MNTFDTGYHHDAKLYNHALDAIQTERGWRINELRYFEKQMRLADNKKDGFNKDIDYAVRSSVVMLYSHLEGYIKKISEIYLDYINKLKISFLSLNPGLRAGVISLARLELKKSNTYYDSKKNKDHRVLYKKYEEYFSRNDHINIFANHKNETRLVDVLLDVDSNLNEKKFKNILELLDIDDFKYEDDFKKISKIITARNRIAHGEKKISINYDDCIRLYNWFIDEITLKYEGDIDSLMTGNSRFHINSKLSKLFHIAPVDKQNCIVSNLKNNFNSVKWCGLSLSHKYGNRESDYGLYFGYYSKYNEGNESNSLSPKSFISLEEDSIIFILKTHNLTKLYHMDSSCILPMYGNYIISSLQDLNVSISKDHIRDEYIIIVNVDNKLISKIELVRNILYAIERSNYYIQCVTSGSVL